MPENCWNCGGSGVRCCEFGADNDVRTIVERERREHPLPPSFDPRNYMENNEGVKNMRRRGDLPPERK